jgi:hypothetical protein
LAGSRRIAAIGEPLAGVEQEEVGRAGGTECARHGLRLVEQERERPLPLERQFLHRPGAVLRIGHGVVGIDGDRADTSRGVLRDHALQLRQHVLHERAVIADEHHQRALGSGGIALGDRSSARGVGE